MLEFCLPFQSVAVDARSDLCIFLAAQLFGPGSDTQRASRYAPT